MSRFGKKLTIFGIWAGLGILVGLQFGGAGGMKVSNVLPGFNPITNTPTNQVTSVNPQTITNGTFQNGQTYVYVPMVVDPVTGTYTTVPIQNQQKGTVPTMDIPQQVEGVVTTLTPEQILIPEGQKPTVDVLADKTANLLQQASQKSIRWVVSLFGSAEE